MLNQNYQQQYNHNEYVKCREIGDFAKIYNFKDRSGKLLGRNKIFRILRSLGILNKDNVPYQSYMKYFKTMEKVYSKGEYDFNRIIPFITPDGQTYLSTKINEYLDKH